MKLVCGKLWRMPEAMAGNAAQADCHTKRKDSLSSTSSTTVNFGSPVCSLSELHPCGFDAALAFNSVHAIQHMDRLLHGYFLVSNIAQSRSLHNLCWSHPIKRPSSEYAHRSSGNCADSPVQHRSHQSMQLSPMPASKKFGVVD
jgi:hypothetical protein